MRLLPVGDEEERSYISQGAGPGSRGGESALDFDAVTALMQAAVQE